MEMNLVAERIRPIRSKPIKRKNPNPFFLFLLFLVLCGILLVRYIFTDTKVYPPLEKMPSATLKYTVDGYSVIIHSEPFLPPDNKQAENYWQILQRTVNDDEDDSDRRWVYELQTLGEYEYKNLRKRPPLLQLAFGETYKYGVAKDRGTFETSMNARYPNNQMYLYVNIFEFMKAESLRTSFKPIRKHPTPLSYKKAELLERVLRFNYYLENGKLPPGSAKF